MNDHSDNTDLVVQWAEQLHRAGGVQVRYTDDEDLARYRRSGRAAGKLLQRPVQIVARVESSTLPWPIGATIR